MASTISAEVNLDSAVREFLRWHVAEPQFEKVCELVHGCFPGLLSVDVVLSDDPDEEGRTQALVCVKLPNSYPIDQLQAAVRRYHEHVVQEIPLAYCPLFALVTEFASE